jgi:glycosyltransferase involved in cell wall biosynthesis
MRIAIVSLLLPSGSKIGVGYVVHHFANQLVERGHDVTVFSQTGPTPDSRYSVEIVPSGQRFRTFGFAWNLRHVDFTRYDVLNAHGDDWFLWGRPRPRHIHTYHGSLLAETMHADGILDKVRMALLAVCELGSCFLADDLVAVSNNTRVYIPMVKHVIPNGVDLARFHPGQKSPRPSLLFVGTMHGRKRGAMLLQIFRETIRPAIPDAEFWAVCDEPLETGDGVVWCGRVSGGRLAGLYRRAWVFCLPSSYEGFGVPYIEAMASGTPVVASPNPGAVEVTGQGRWGVIASDADLPRELQALLTDAERRSELAEAGLRRARDFGWETVCSSYERLFAQPQHATVVPA